MLFSLPVTAAQCALKPGEYRKVFDQPLPPETHLPDMPIKLEEGAVLVEEHTIIIPEGWQVEDPILGPLPGFNLVAAGSSLEVWSNGEERRACGPSEWLQNSSVCFTDRDKDGTFETYLEMRSKQSGRTYVDKKLRRLPVLQRWADLVHRPSDIAKVTNVVTAAVVRLDISQVRAESFDLALTSSLTTKVLNIDYKSPDEKRELLQTITIPRAAMASFSFAGYTIEHGPDAIQSVTGSFKTPHLELSCDGTILTLGNKRARVSKKF